MKNNRTKNIMLSLVLAAAMMSPMAANAQGLFGKASNGPQNEHHEGGMLRSGNPTINGNGITNGDFNEPTSPLGSGIAILIGAGLGYVALKKKEDKQ